MTQSNLLAPRHIDSLKAYKELPVESRCAIVAAVSNLKMMRANGQLLTPEVIVEKLTPTGHLILAFSCYEIESIAHQQWS